MASRPIFACVLISFLTAAAALVFVAPAAWAAVAPDETCVPSLQRLLSCLDFIEHRTDEIPVPCCVQVRRTVAEQPCCLMHVMRGNAARLIGPEYDNARAMVNVTAECLGDPPVLVSITRNCSGKPLPPLTPEFTFTSAAVPPPPPSSSGATRLQGLSSSTSLLLALIASIVIYGAMAVLQN
ncbi:hypothetical protein BAE44_0026080 [Dichanthelium oligosanthes]|uniref:Bifunctional inhibitor/plant lipid transfer protein/seed storage helical domain-containing protein n=1 Tax=Dichanthelium oligosanthes TaxID=888268 RepID=A0A1E5UJ57_9POAL|nr:hypothetical protein BAE44_0026080 [Dichanthelium oligosanthes]